MQSNILLFLIRVQARTRCSVKRCIQHQTTVLKTWRKSNNTPLLWSIAQGLATWSKETNVNSVIFLYKTHPYSTPLLEKNKGKNLCLANSKGVFSNFAQSFFCPFWRIYLCFGFLFGANSLIFAFANKQFSTQFEQKTESKMQQIASLTARDSLAFCSILPCVLLQLAVLKPGFYTNIMKE